MTEAAPLLVASVWTGSGADHTEVAATSWAVVEIAIRALDGGARCDLYLQPDPADPETYLAVAGGSFGRYLVFICHGNERFVEATTPHAPDADVDLVTGGQAGTFNLRDLVTLDEALEAARYYYETGEPAASISWRYR